MTIQKIKVSKRNGKIISDIYNENNTLIGVGEGFNYLKEQIGQDNLKYIVNIGKKTYVANNIKIKLSRTAYQDENLINDLYNLVNGNFDKNNELPRIENKTKINQQNNGDILSSIKTENINPGYGYVGPSDFNSNEESYETSEEMEEKIKAEEKRLKDLFEKERLNSLIEETDNSLDLEMDEFYSELNEKITTAKENVCDSINTVIKKNEYVELKCESVKKGINKFTDGFKRKIENSEKIEDSLINSKQIIKEVIYLLSKYSKIVLSNIDTFTTSKYTKFKENFDDNLSLFKINVNTQKTLIKNKLSKSNSFNLMINKVKESSFINKIKGMMVKDSKSTKELMADIESFIKEYENECSTEVTLNNNIDTLDDGIEFLEYPNNYLKTELKKLLKVKKELISNFRENRFENSYVSKYSK